MQSMHQSNMNRTPTELLAKCQKHQKYCYKLKGIEGMESKKTQQEPSNISLKASDQLY